MKKNIGPKNRAGRIIAGVVMILIAAYIGFQNIFSWPIVAIGIIAIIEGLLSYCFIHGAKGTCNMR